MITNIKNKLMLNRFTMLIIGIIAIPILVFGVQMAMQSSTVSAANVQLFFSPEKANVPPETTFNLFLDTESQKVSFVNLEVRFDNSILRLAEEISTTSTFGTVISKSSRSEANSSGRIKIILALSPDQREVAPSGLLEIARLRFRSDSNLKTEIFVDTDNSQVVDIDSAEMGISQVSAVINPTEPTSTAPPSQTPTPSPSGTPTPPIGQKTILLPIEDTFVNERYSSSNYGSRDEVISDGSPRKIIYLKFDLAELNLNDFNSAKLEVVPNKNRRIEKIFKLMPDSNWDQNSISWRTQPNLDQAKVLGSFSGLVRQSDSVEFDLDYNILRNYSGQTVTILIDDLSSGYTLETNSIESEEPGIQLILDAK